MTKITYAYDPAGHRISKIQENSGTSTKQYTWYAADAQGNTQALYVSSGTSLSGLVINGSKWYMYGSSRLGTYNFQVGLSGGTSSIKNVTSFTGRRGVRYYELNDHLGNELVTVEDRKVEVVSPSNSSLISYYKPFVVGAQQYAPFGMRLPSRIVGAGSYWYGFNGQEKDNELEGEWNLYGAQYWEYDPRAVVRWNTDPKPEANTSPYLVFRANPILHSDPLGDSGINPIMPRHPINGPSDYVNIPYNFVGSFVNDLQSLFNKGGEYVQAVSKGDPVAGFNSQVSSDYNSIKQFVNGQINYFANTSNKQIANDAKEFFSNPDNYFKGAEQTIEIFAAGKFSLNTEASFTKISVTKDFTLKSTGVSEEGAGSLIQANRKAGNAFRDEIATLLQQEGRQVSKEVFKKTPFGRRFIDIEVSYKGNVLGGIETKVGSSRYNSLQQLKDLWLYKVQGYPVNLVRKTK